jgi:hypothetical protein
LSGQLLGNQLPRNLQGSPRLTGERLGAPQSGIGRSYWAGHGKHRAVTFEHHESSILIGQPAERGQRNESIRPNHNEAAKTMTDTGEAIRLTCSDPIFHDQVTAFDANLNSVSEAVAGRKRKAFQEAARQFTAKRGRKPKARRLDYRKIGMIYPVCLRLLTELRFETPNYSVRELLEHLKQDDPEACNFLLRHLARFESTLKDKRLLKRAIRIESRARLLADGMAGADYGLKAEPLLSAPARDEG